ncbi:hypothetical protein GCM10010389_53080 [Streptomyces echinoruber]|uniref:Uncharacterized protein n=1 Tax=Streptomyces echinoruber TaxID=68898 RepID=A0A918RPA6_9ACTN|nr:hypothetical protein GCM10010389_53080 [Streptomyces echinoruber]
MNRHTPHGPRVAQRFMNRHMLRDPCAERVPSRDTGARCVRGARAARLAPPRGRHRNAGSSAAPGRSGHSPGRAGGRARNRPRPPARRGRIRTLYGWSPPVLPGSSATAGNNRNGRARRTDRLRAGRDTGPEGHRGTAPLSGGPRRTRARLPPTPATMACVPRHPGRMRGSGGHAGRFVRGVVPRLCTVVTIRRAPLA